MKRTMLALSAVLLVAAPAAISYRYAQGRAAVDERAIRERLDRVPMRFGDWEARAPDEEDVSAFHDERYPGFLRRYADAARGREVLLLVRGGPPGPLVYHHKPQSCYRAAGFDPSGAGAPAHPVCPGGDFAATNFSKSDVTAEHVRLFWAWSGDGVWDAPEEPRFRFSGYPVLFRAYVVRRTGSPSEPYDGDWCEEFIRTALPDLNRALFDR